MWGGRVHLLFWKGGPCLWCPGGWKQVNSNRQGYWIPLSVGQRNSLHLRLILSICSAAACEQHARTTQCEITPGQVLTPAAGNSANMAQASVGANTRDDVPGSRVTRGSAHQAIQWPRGPRRVFEFFQSQIPICNIRAAVSFLPTSQESRSSVSYSMETDKCDVAGNRSSQLGASLSACLASSSLPFFWTPAKDGFKCGR